MLSQKVVAAAASSQSIRCVALNLSFKIWSLVTTAGMLPLLCLQVAVNKLGKAPMTPRTAVAVAAAAANSDAFATITLGNAANSLNRGSFRTSPTKAQANLGRTSSGVWSAMGAAAGPGPVRVLLGLPSEGAEAVLQHFQQQVGNSSSAA